jgi:hypothetical protein
MLDENAIRHYLIEAHPNSVNLLLRVRSKLKEFLPQHEEHLRWRVLFFYKPNPKTTIKDTICSLKPERKKVTLVFHLGALLDDPDQLLEGNQRYKRTLTLTDFETFDRPEVTDLILRSYSFDSNRVLYKLLPNADYQELRSKI